MLEVVRSCGDRRGLLDAIERHQPDAVITEVGLPPAGTDEGIQVARSLRVSAPAIGVVVLSRHSDPRDVRALLDGGSGRRGFLLKDSITDRHQLVAAVKATVAGGSVIDPRAVEALISAGDLGARSRLSALTARECDVLEQIAQGKSNFAIARSLGIHKRSLENHVNAIFTKLGLRGDETISPRVKAGLIYSGGDLGHVDRHNGEVAFAAGRFGRAPAHRSLPDGNGEKRGPQ
jgi:DNA-binding NarL/FixJ family response regulator